MFASVHNDMTQHELIESARREGAQVYGTSRMWFSKTGPESDVLIGFSAIALDDIAPGVRALARAWL